ncbi:TetR/AcrR family transcriptional regulator [Arthrobacter agilis]|uniref:TetR/AcrR family transcriptional regulator n=1 Tax=Arthrobacter agilis TaxID=37921 RepID=UPI0027D843DC|nr:TetR/AcrR family transcriptional regulator [Arthrobacter agilis]
MHTIPSAPERSKRRRLAPEVRRAEVLDVAARLLSERGYWAVSVQDVAQAAGMTKTGLLHHFPTKESLLVALLEERDRSQIDEAEAHIAELDKEGGRAFLDAVVESNWAHRELIRLYAVLNVEALDPRHPAHDYFRRRFERARDVIRRAAASWHPNPDSFALEVHVFLDGLQIAWLRDESLPVRELWHDFAARACDV